MDQIQTNELYKLAGGITTTGYTTYNCLQYDNYPNPAIWCNLCLTYPYINIPFPHNKDIAIETTLDEINEHTMYTTYLLTVCYYIIYGRQLLNKNINSSLKITIQVHQNMIGMNIINILNEYIADFTNIHHISLNNIIIGYRIDYNFVQYYTNTDILISLSTCIGLDVPPNNFIIPTIFIPYNIRGKEIQWTKQQTIKNSLTDNLQNIIDSKYNQLCVDYINQQYKSQNINKINHKAEKINKTNFYQTPLYLIDQVWIKNEKIENIIIS
jgi:hypothetical protein